MFATDMAEKHAGLSLEKLERILGDIKAQPEWRTEANRAAAYYDSNQIEPEVAAAMEERGQPILINNLIAPTIDGVLGAEAKTRVDWLIKADDDEGQEVAEALNEKLNEAARLSEADQSCADAYAGQIKTGIGWVEVRRNPDPFGSAYETSYVHRREIYWDWHSKKRSLADARWLARRRWMDVDQAVAYFPGFEEIIKQSINGWNGITDDEQLLVTNPALIGAYNDYSQFSIDDSEWIDTDREQVMVHELYYRVYVTQPVLKTANGEVFTYDKNNRVHVAAVASRQVEVSVVPFPVMRLAWFIGPHRIADMPSPHPHNHFPYVPFFGFREDATGVPYGLIRRMMPAQDEVNFRRSKLTWLLNAKRVIMDDDATEMSDAAVLDEVSRADGLVVLNPTRKNKDADAFRVETDFNIAAQQFQVMQDAQKQIQDTAGVYSSFLGQQDGGATSGVAINSLVEQGATTLSEINDNYRYAKRLVGELITANIVHDLSKERDVKVLVGVNEHQKTKRIMLNTEQEDEFGYTRITNDVMRTKSHVVLADISSTPGYRAQVTDRLMQLVQGLPPEMQAAVIDIVIESTDLPKKKEILDRIRKATGQGMDPEDMTEEDKQAYQLQMEKKQQQEQLLMQQQQLAIEEMTTKIEKLRNESAQLAAKTRQLEALTEHEDAKERQTEAKTQQIMVEMQNLTQEMQQLREGFVHNLDQQIDALAHTGP